MLDVHSSVIVWVGNLDQDALLTAEATRYAVVGVVCHRSVALRWGQPHVVTLVPRDTVA